MAHLVVESLVNGVFSPNTSELILRVGYFGCHSKGTDEKFHSELKSKRFDSKKHHEKSLTDNCLHPVHHMSKKTIDAEKKYNSYELEVLAIVQTLKKFRIYLLGHHFKLSRTAIPSR